MSPLFSAEKSKFQIDLIFVRSTHIITISEIKYWNAPIDTSVIPEMNSKIEKLKVKSGVTLEKLLISPFGTDESLRKAKYFHHIFTLKDLFLKDLLT